MSKKYANPPVVEAVCEFRLSPDTMWDLTIPGLIYEKIDKTIFKNKEERFIQEIELTNTPQGLQHNVQTNKRILFQTDDKKKFIQVGPHLLTVNRLKPYNTWDEFKPQIEQAFNALNNAIEIKGIQRLGLRYINLIEIPSPLVDIDEYFDFKPVLGENLPQHIVSFIVGCVLSFSEGRDSCKIQLTNAVPEKDGQAAFMLDLDYSLSKPQTISKEFVLEWVEQAHNNIESIFEGCITDRLRDVFQEVK